jgi:hypothetical protein
MTRKPKNRIPWSRNAQGSPPGAGPALDPLQDANAVVHLGLSSPPPTAQPAQKRAYCEINNDFLSDADSDYSSGDVSNSDSVYSKGEYFRLIKRRRRRVSPTPDKAADATLAQAIKKINTQVHAWERGEVHSLVSAEESDSSIDWDQPDITPSEACSSFPS